MRTLEALAAIALAVLVLGTFALVVALVAGALCGADQRCTMP